MRAEGTLSVDDQAELYSYLARRSPKPKGFFVACVALGYSFAVVVGSVTGYVTHRVEPWANYWVPAFTSAGTVIVFAMVLFVLLPLFNRRSGSIDAEQGRRLLKSAGCEPVVGPAVFEAADGWLRIITAQDEGAVRGDLVRDIEMIDGSMYVRCTTAHVVRVPPWAVQQMGGEEAVRGALLRDEPGEDRDQSAV